MAVSRRTTRKWVNGILLLIVVVLTAVTFLPMLGTNMWWVRFLSFPRLQFLCALIVLLVLCVALPWRLYGSRMTAFVLAAVALGYQCAFFIPYTFIWPVQARAAQGCPAEQQVRLLEANLQMTNEHDNRLFNEIRQYQPDVILAEEVDQWWHSCLSQLEDRYPYHQSHVSQNYYGIELLSRKPLVNPQVVFPANSRDPAIFSGLQLGSGATIRLYGIHPRPPTFGQSSAERDAEVMYTALQMADQKGPEVLAGDLNATPWSPVVRRAARIAHLVDPRIGRGWNPTWKANAIVMRWPLDNILFSEGLAVTDYRVLPPFGSDHQPLLLTLCDTPSQNSGAAPQPTPGDIEAAKHAVRVGQGKAAPSPQPKTGMQSPQD